MVDQFKKFLEVFKALGRQKVDYVLIGGVAVILHGNEFYIDIMARAGELATFEDLEYEIIDYQGIKIKIAKPESLFRLKKDSIRDKDKIDAIFLKKLIEAGKINQPGHK
jgi:hypothetical protein